MPRKTYQRKTLWAATMMACAVVATTAVAPGSAVVIAGPVAISLLAGLLTTVYGATACRKDPDPAQILVDSFSSQYQNFFAGKVGYEYFLDMQQWLEGETVETYQAAFKSMDPVAEATFALGGSAILTSYESPEEYTEPFHAPEAAKSILYADINSGPRTYCAEHPDSTQSVIAVLPGIGVTLPLRKAPEGSLSGFCQAAHTFFRAELQRFFAREKNNGL